MDNELCGSISCILNELSVRSNNDAKKEKVRRIISDTCENILRTSNCEQVKDVFRYVAVMASRGGNNDKEILHVFSQLAALIMGRDLFSRIYEFENERQEAPPLGQTDIVKATAKSNN